ncbi:MAG: AAA-associated domain-containing protein [Oligoflexia bacterium]
MDKPGGTASTLTTANESNQPLPQVGISEILGLVELLRAKGGREDIYKLARELQMEFGETLTVIRAAELMGLVHTPGGDVEVDKKGDEIGHAKIGDRKGIIHDQLLKLPVFKTLSDFLKEKEDHTASRDQVLEKLAELIPNENAEQTFNTLVQWGRYAELFGYNDDRETFYLDIEQPETPA